jgi:hypothetical protein
MSVAMYDKVTSGALLDAGKEQTLRSLHGLLI